MAEIPTKLQKIIRKGAKKLADAADRRKRAEEALGQPIDDLTYERLGHAKTFAEIYQIASAHDELDIWDIRTLKFLHLADSQNRSEAYFMREMRALRRSVTET